MAKKQESIYVAGKTCDTKKDQLERIAVALEQMQNQGPMNPDDFIKREHSGTVVLAHVDGTAAQPPGLKMTVDGVPVFEQYHFVGLSQSGETGQNHADGVNIVYVSKDLEIAGPGRVDIAGGITSIGAPGREVGFFGESSPRIAAPALLPGANAAEIAVNKIINDLKAYGLYQP